MKTFITNDFSRIMKAVKMDFINGKAVRNEYF